MTHNGTELPKEQRMERMHLLNEAINNLQESEKPETDQQYNDKESK